MHVSKQVPLRFTADDAPDQLLPGRNPLYTTERGSAYVGDAQTLLSELPDASVNLVFTSPPYALHFKKEYGNASKAEYVEWFLPFARQIQRVLRPDGSFVLNIGGSYNKGEPTRSVYHFRLMLALIDEVGFHLAQECFWYNPAKMPMPAEWVTVRRVRIKDSVEYLWWFSRTPNPKANNRRVLRPYGADMIRLNQRGLTATTRPSGHHIKKSFEEIGAGGAIPGNLIDPAEASDLLRHGNNSANDTYTRRCKEDGIKIHPARFPSALPDFFVRLLTDEGDLVVDPFAGSNTTGAAAESLDRNWLAMDLSEEYLAASRFRFE